MITLNELLYLLCQGKRRSSNNLIPIQVFEYRDDGLFNKIYLEESNTYMSRNVISISPEIEKQTTYDGTGYYEQPVLNIYIK